VILSAAAGSGSSFAGWSGACSGTGTCSVTMNGASTVTATFNKKPAPKCVVPNVKGKPLTTARKKISAAHCKVGKVTHVRSKTVKKGKIVSQKPKPATKLAAGGKVKLVVSKGKR
jgi:beta-lactam-binding protein with PASTA domain